jgi:hypothetical protein
MAIARAMLIGSDGRSLYCQFNPETVERTKGARWQAFETRGSDDQPRPQFVGTGPESLSVRLLFDGLDTLGAPGMPVEDAVEMLLRWTTVPPEARDQATPQPPTVTFQWGTGLNFTGVIEAVGVKYTMFGVDGRALRAIATIAMRAVPVTPLGTNPTSGGMSGRASAQVGDGDSLPSIAQKHYGDPNLWRGIAAANGLSHPSKDLPPSVMLPSLAEAAAASEVRDG